MKFLHKLALRLLPGMHDVYQDQKRRARRLNKENGKLRAAIARIEESHEELRQIACELNNEAMRAVEMRDSLFQLVAKDDDGKWVTVFDAETVLPEEVQSQLEEFISAT